MSSSFSRKRLVVSLTSAGGTVGAGKENTVILDGLRTILEVEKGGHPSKNCAKLRVYGMKTEDMEALTTTAFRALHVRRVLVRVDAGDEHGVSLAFQGEASGAWAVYHQPPDLFFRVEAASGYYPAVTPASPTSAQGGAQVSQLMKTLADGMGYAFEDNGVEAVLANPYLHGGLMQQAGQLADAAGVEFGVDDETLWIAPPEQPRKGEAPLVSPDTGMIGYPVFDKEGILVHSLWNPAFKHGGLIKVDSDIKACRGLWRVHGLKHHLEAEHPGGKWESILKGTWVGEG